MMITALLLVLAGICVALLISIVALSPIKQSPDYQRINAIERDLGLPQSNYKGFGVEPVDTSSSVIQDNEKFLAKADRDLMDPVESKLLELQEQIVQIAAIPLHQMGRRIFHCSACKQANWVGTVIPNQTLCDKCKSILYREFSKDEDPFVIY